MLGPVKSRDLDRPVLASLETLVPKDHFYRRLEQALDLSFVRDWVTACYADSGRPSVDPIVFFKLQIIMLVEGIRSERKRIELASLNLAHRWYVVYCLDEPLPDHSTLTRIRQRLGLLIFRRFFEHIVDLCDQAGLVWGKELYFDATKVQANASLDSLQPRFAVDEHLRELFHQEESSIGAPDTLDEHPNTAEPAPLVPALSPEVREELTQENSARHDWIAVEERGRDKRSLLDVRVGLCQPQVFQTTNNPGDWCCFAAPITPKLTPAPLDDFPIRLLTGTNHGRAAAGSWTQPPGPPDTYVQRSDISQFGLVQMPPQSDTIGAVGVATDFFQPSTDEGLTFLARNQQGESGQCGFYYLALGGPQDVNPAKIFVDTGATPSWNQIGGLGAIDDSALGTQYLWDTGYWHIYFSRPFLAPPAVFVSAAYGSQDVDPPWMPTPTLGQAHDVTPHGFTLVGQNAAADEGLANLHWMALGWVIDEFAVK